MVYGLIKSVYNRIAVILIIGLIFGACNKSKLKSVKFRGEAQGTYYSISYYEKDGKNYQFQIDSLLHVFDLSCSIYDSSSIISRINRNDSSVILDSLFLENLRISEMVSSRTNGAFDITVGPLVNAWGFGFKNKIPLDSAKVDSLKKFIGYRKIKVVNNKIVKDDPRMSLDFNAIAQGYSVEYVARFLEQKGIKNYLIDIGGEVKAKGTKFGGDLWSVGIEKPASNKSSMEQQVHLILKISNTAIATSGNYRKYFEEKGIRYSHTIDPYTGYPARHTLLSVSVIYKNTAVADAFATAFMVMGLEKSKIFLEKNTEMEAYFIYDDGKGGFDVWQTPGFDKYISGSVE